MQGKTQTTLLCELTPLKYLPFKTPLIFNIQTITRFLKVVNDFWFLLRLNLWSVTIGNKNKVSVLVGTNRK